MSVGIFNILWDRPLFYAGDPIVGKVKFNVTKTLKARGIKVTLLGSASYTATKRVKRGNRYTNVTDTITDKFFEQAVEVLPGAGQTQELQPGDYEYPFSWQLPGSSPSTWVAKTTGQGGFFDSGKPKGMIKYTAKGEIDVPMGFDKSCETIFNVTNVRDLNNYVHLANPVSLNRSKEVGFLCFTSGRIVLTASLDKSGFVPGEKMEAKIECNNQSSKPLKLLLKFMQIVKYKGRIGETIPLMTHNLAPQQPGQTDSIKHSMQVMQLVPSGMNEYNTVDICYEIHVEATAEGGIDQFPLKVQIPITIGNIPFKADFPKFQKICSPNRIA